MKLCQEINFFFKGEALCPLLTIAKGEEVQCIGSDCAFWVARFMWDEDTGEFHDRGYGNCGLVHPGHQKG